jgi:hypothetical protein
MRALETIVAAILLVALTGPDAFAQNGQASSIVGTVADQSGGVVPGVRMSARSPDMIGGDAAAVTDERGQYRFPSLLPGVYELTAEHSGFQTWRRGSIELRAGLGVVVDIRLELAGFEQAASVSASASIVTAPTSAVPTVIDRQWLEHVPLSKDFPSYVNLVPGVSDSIAFGGTPAAISASLDGTDVSQPEFGWPDIQPNVYWLDSIQVVSLGANAQYGEYTGGVMNAVTRSGSNAWSGLFDFWLMRNAWTGDNRRTLDYNTALAFVPPELLEHWDASPQLGGPIKRDRLWVFGGFERYTRKARSGAFGLQPRSPDEPVVNELATKNLVKLTAAGAKSLRLEGYFAADGGTLENGGAGPFTAPEAVFEYTHRREISNARLTWTPSPRTLLEARYGFYNAHNTIGPTPPNSRSGPPGHYDSFLGTSTGNYNWFDETWRRRHIVGMNVTRFAERGAAESHQIKAGIEHERASNRDESGYPGGMSFLDYNGAPDAVVIGDVALVRGVHRRTSAFVQDTWQASDRLTIEPGLRVGSYHGAVPAEGVPTYDTWSASPRIGAAWAVTPDHRTVVRAHYGVYHEALFATVYDQFDPASHPGITVARVIAPNQFQEVTRIGGNSVRMEIDPAVRQPYADEYVAGVDREIGTGMVLRAQYIRRNFRQTVGFIDNGTTWTAATAIDPGPDGVIATSDDLGPITLHYDDGSTPASLLLTNPSNAWRLYEGVQIVATRRARGRWSAEASYTWSRTRGSFDNESGSNAAFSDLGLYGNFTLPDRALYTGFVSTSDRPHDVKILGTVEPCCGIRVSGVYRYLTGRPWSREINVDALTRLFSIGVEPTGARRMDATYNDADLRVEKMFTIARSARIGAYVDVFNINDRGVALSVERRSGPHLGIPKYWHDPRTVRLGFRLTF